MNRGEPGTLTPVSPSSPWWGQKETYFTQGAVTSEGSAEAMWSEVGWM